MDEGWLFGKVNIRRRGCVCACVCNDNCQVLLGLTATPYNTFCLLLGILRSKLVLSTDVFRNQQQKYFRQLHSRMFVFYQPVSSLLLIPYKLPSDHLFGSHFDHTGSQFPTSKRLFLLVLIRSISSLVDQFFGSWQSQKFLWYKRGIWILLLGVFFWVVERVSGATVCNLRRCTPPYTLYFFPGHGLIYGHRFPPI